MAYLALITSTDLKGQLHIVYVGAQGYINISTKNKSVGLGCDSQTDKNA